jgi:hypothetical protein
MEKVIPRLSRAPVILTLAFAGSMMAGEAGAAAPEDDDRAAEGEPGDGEVYDETHYGERNTIELGGSVALSYLRNDFNVSVAPQFGWFFVDRWELTAFVRYGYSNELDGNTRTDSHSGGFTIEPSYHHPIRPDVFYVFGGLGLGMSHAESGRGSANSNAFEAVPRLGLNIQVGRSGFLNPALRVPILVGGITGPDEEEFGVVVGVAFEIGYTTAF